jgi:hypothetical protein
MLRKNVSNQILPIIVQQIITFLKVKKKTDILVDCVLLPVVGIDYQKQINNITLQAAFLNIN